MFPVQGWFGEVTVRTGHQDLGSVITRYLRGALIEEMMYSVNLILRLNLITSTFIINLDLITCDANIFMDLISNQVHLFMDQIVYNFLDICNATVYLGPLVTTNHLFAV